MALTIAPLLPPGPCALAPATARWAFERCPATLANTLAGHGRLPDEATDRQGNCSIDAFARRFMAQMIDGCVSAGQTESARNRKMKTTLDQVSLLRRVGVACLEANASESHLARHGRG